MSFCGIVGSVCCCLAFSHLHLVVVVLFRGLEVFVIIVLVEVVPGSLGLGGGFGVVDGLAASASAGDDVTGVDWF